jgi:hypothetical protein
MKTCETCYFKDQAETIAPCDSCAILFCGMQFDCSNHSAVGEHDSDCSVHNMPAYPNKKCDCKLSK